MNTNPNQDLRDLICEELGMDCRHYGDRHANDCEEVRDVILAAGWVSPEEHCAELDGARAEVERHAQRAEKAEAEVKHIKSTMVGHFRVHAETIARIQDAKATIARVEALAEKWDRPSMVGIASGIRAALAEPERDEEGS